MELDFFSACLTFVLVDYFSMGVIKTAFLQEKYIYIYAFLIE